MECYISPQNIKDINLRSVPEKSKKIATGRGNESNQNNKIPLGFTYAYPTNLNLLPIILLVLIVSDYIIPAGNYPKALNYSPNNQNPGESDDKTIMVSDILSSIFPYVMPEHQNGVNFVMGLIETRAKIKSLMEGTYQAPNIKGLKSAPISYQERAIGIIKSLQPYISLKNQTVINKILDTNTTMVNLFDKIEKFRRSSYTGLQDQTTMKIMRIIEIVDILEILMTKEQHKQIKQIKNMLKMVQAAELARKFNMQDTEITTKNTQDEDNINPNLSRKSPTLDGDELSVDKTENISTIAEPMLNPDQTKSLKLIMDMAKMLSGNSAKQESAD